MLPRNPEEVRAEANRLFRSGADNETVFAFLKRNGAGPFDALAFLRETQALSIIEAKRIIHDSETWAYARIDWDRELKEIKCDLDDKL
jgi:hypothetical protein